MVQHYFPADGEYAVSIADMAGALWVHDMEVENTVIGMLDGKEFFRTTIGGEANKGLGPGEAVAAEPAKEFAEKWGDPKQFVDSGFRSL